MGDVLTDAEARIAVLRTQISTSPVQFTENDVNLLDELRGQLVELRALYDGEKRSAAVLKRTATLKDKEISQLEAAVSSKAKEIESAENRARDQVESIRNEMAEAYEKVAQASSDLTNARREIDTLLAGEKEIRLQLEKAEGQLENRRENDAQLREGWFSMKRERDGLTEKLEEMTRQLDAARGRIEEVIAEKVEAVGEAERRYADLEAKFAEGPLGELIGKADALTSIGHGIDTGDKVDAGSKSWADNAYAVLKSLAGLKL